MMSSCYVADLHAYAGVKAMTVRGNVHFKGRFQFRRNGKLEWTRTHPAHPDADVVARWFNSLDAEFRE